MSPTIFRKGPYRFFFFSREEPRLHIHVISGDGEGKYWIEPKIELSSSAGFNQSQLTEIEKIIREHEHEIRDKWQQHFNA